MTLYAKSKLAINTRALTLNTYQEDGSRAKTMMTMALHHQEERQDQTRSPALTMTREQVDDKDQMEVKMAPFATEGAEGIAKCPSTWPAHFAASHYPQLCTASFRSKTTQLFICLTVPAYYTP